MRNETAGGFAIVGCGENPNYQVWGARSDLKCRKRGPKALTMKFKDWISQEERAGSHARQKVKH